MSELLEQLEREQQLPQYYKEELLRMQKQISEPLEITQQQLSLDVEEKEGELWFDDKNIIYMDIGLHVQGWSNCKPGTFQVLLYK